MEKNVSSGLAAESGLSNKRFLSSSRLVDWTAFHPVGLYWTGSIDAVATTHAHELETLRVSF